MKNIQLVYFFFMSKRVNKVYKEARIPKVTRVSHTCVGDSESDPGVDIFPWCGDDTPVDIVITTLERSRGYREGSCRLIVCNGASVTQPVPWRFHNNVAQFICPPFAPVLCVVSEPQVVVASYFDRAAIRSHYLFWSREINGIHGVFHKPQETENWCFKGGEKNKSDHIEYSRKELKYFTLLFYHGKLKSIKKEKKKILLP